MRKHKRLGGRPVAITPAPKRPARIGLIKLPAEPETLCIVVSTALDGSHSPAMAPGRLISDVLPGRTDGTVDIVESTYELVSTGIYFEAKETSQKRITVPAGTCRISELTDEDRFTLATVTARLEAGAILRPHLTLLNNDDSPVIDLDAELDLGDGVNLYRVPAELPAEEANALKVLLATDLAEQFVSDGGDVSGVMLGMSFASALESLHVKRHEPAVRRTHKIQSSLPAARAAKSAKTAAHKQWAQDVFQKHLMAAGKIRKIAYKKMAEEFTVHYPDAKPVTPRTIGDWVANKRPAR